MKNLLTTDQMRDADAYTIKHKNISSIDLMEHASSAFVKAFTKEVGNKSTQITILCGRGNNGGDGLAIARLLSERKYKNVSVGLINFFTKQSEDYATNLKKLIKTTVKIFEVKEPEQLKALNTEVIVDAILGSGLNKPLAGKYLALAKVINEIEVKVISVDVPTGFNSEGVISDKYNGVKADLVITFEQPKLNFLFPDSTKALEKFKVVKIGLDKKYIQNQESDFILTTKYDISKLLKPRKKFSYKGTYGHAVLVAGSNATMGAGLLAANACLRSGAGLTTLCLPQSGITALNVLLPEVMALSRNHYLDEDTFSKFTAISIGPGLGLENGNESLFKNIIDLKKPLIIDADALTILSKREDLLNSLTENSILTPHVSEFDRIFGTHTNWWDRIQTAKEQASKRKLVIILKNQYTFVCLPNRKVFINQTGNPAMSSGGMGDVLTGIITALVAQDYSSADAAILGVYLHGKAGDELAKNFAVVTANQVANQIPKTIKKLL